MKNSIKKNFQSSSDSDWDKLPLTYNQYEVSSRFSFDVNHQNGYYYDVN